MLSNAGMRHISAANIDPSPPLPSAVRQWRPSLCRSYPRPEHSQHICTGVGQRSWEGVQRGWHLCAERDTARATKGVDDTRLISLGAGAEEACWHGWGPRRAAHAASQVRQRCDVNGASDTAHGRASPHDPSSEVVYGVIWLRGHGRCAAAGKCRPHSLLEVVAVVRGLRLRHGAPLPLRDFRRAL